VGEEKSNEIIEKMSRPVLGRMSSDPGGVSSPVRAFKSLDVTPLIVDRGEKDMIWDVDGNAYNDYCGSWGRLSSSCTEECRRGSPGTSRRGSSFGITTLLRSNWRAKSAPTNASMEQLRFVSSGTEATMSAVRLARGFTGKNLIIKFFDGQTTNGHADTLLIQAGFLGDGRPCDIARCASVCCL